MQNYLYHYNGKTGNRCNHSNCFFADGCNDPRPKTFPQSGSENQNGPFGSRVDGEGGGDGGGGGGADSTARIHLISVVFTTLSSVAFILF